MEKDNQSCSPPLAEKDGSTTSTDDVTATVASYFDENPHLSNGSTVVPRYYMVHLSQLGSHVKLLLKRSFNQQQQRIIVADESVSVGAGTAQGGRTSNAETGEASVAETEKEEEED